MGKSYKGNNGLGYDNKDIGDLLNPDDEEAMLAYFLKKSGDRA